jgi:hypothetical protein
MFILIFAFFSIYSFASQPSGLVLTPPLQPRGVRILRNKHITYSDKEERIDDQEVYKTKFKVKGRSRPGRSGSVTSIIDSGEIVEPFRESEDGKWKAVLVKKSDLKVWIPSASLTKKKIKKKPHSSSEDSDDFKEDAISEE